MKVAKKLRILKCGVDQSGLGSEMPTIKLSAGRCVVRGIDEVKPRTCYRLACNVINVRKPAAVNLPNKAKNFIHYRSAQVQNIMRNRNEIDFKREEENCVLMNGF